MLIGTLLDVVLLVIWSPSTLPRRYLAAAARAWATAPGCDKQKNKKTNKTQNKHTKEKRKKTNKQTHMT
jgi:hypothetical protein